MQASGFGGLTRKAPMAKSRAARTLSHLAIVVAPLVSVLIIGLATSTSPFAIDAWNTFLNDEHNYYWSVSQMQLFGQPSGITGYNEQAAPNPSYGSYGIFVYLPYYVASFATGVSSHNFIYIINMAFGVLAAALIVILLKPSTRQSLCLAALVLFHFIISRYLCSGMSEGSYVLFAGIVIACALYVVRVGSDGRPALVALALAAIILASAFWGCMRPFLLAYMLVPCALAVTSTCRLVKAARAGIIVLAVAATAASLVLYVYYAKNYVVPYFDSATIATSMGTLILQALPGLPAQHVECVLYSGTRLVHLKWQGIMVFTFAVCWVLLLIMGIRAARRSNKMAAGLLFALVVAGFAIFEAHLLLYSYKQMHRMFIPVDIIYLAALVWFGAGAITRTAANRTGKHTKNKSRSQQGSASPLWVPTVVTVVAVCLLCTGSLALHPDEFKLPQSGDAYEDVDENALRTELSQLMPQSENQWDNTIAHPIETADLWLYFAMPRYLAPTTCKNDYLSQAIADSSFKSKYVSLPASSKLNKKMAAKFTVLYEGQGHVIYQVR